MYRKICSIDNLNGAFIKAKRGKTKRRYIKRFQRNLKQNLERLHYELTNKIYSHKERLRDIKKRLKNTNINFDEIACVMANIKSKKWKNKKVFC